MSEVQEPNIKKGYKPEETFRDAIVEAINNFLQEKVAAGSLKAYFILKNFGLDIAVFIEWPNNRFSVRFFELKAFVGSRKGGVGFGNPQGKGSQVDILLLDDLQLKLANQFVRWLLVDGTKPNGESRYVIFDNIKARNVAMGGVDSNKQNNLSIKGLEDMFTTWDKFLENLNEFLLSN